MSAEDAVCQPRYPEGNAVRRGILLTAVGSSREKARRAFDVFEGAVRSAFPGTPVRWAFASDVVRSRLARQGGKADSVRKALEKMRYEGYSHVAVHALYVLPGPGYGAVAETVQDAADAGDLQKILVSRPLLAEESDIPAVAEAALASAPRERSPGEAVVFMGHGSQHPSQDLYTALARFVRRQDPLVHFGTMVDPGSLDGILAHLTQAGCRATWLMPFMAVAGIHVQEDMAGEKQDSWLSRIQAVGLRCHPVTAGLLERIPFASLWTDRLRAVMEQMSA